MCLQTENQLCNALLGMWVGMWVDVSYFFLYITHDLAFRFCHHDGGYWVCLWKLPKESGISARFQTQCQWSYFRTFSIQLWSYSQKFHKAFVITVFTLNWLHATSNSLLVSRNPNSCITALTWWMSRSHWAK